MLECVVNVSEGRRPDVLAALADACGDDLLDVHADPDHHRAVLTLLGEEAPRRLARAAIDLLDVRTHNGVHPRIGVLDVVPFVPLPGSTMAGAIAARDRFCAWAGDELALPCFRYGDERTLPEVRRGAFTTLAPDCGPSSPHPSAGGCAVGARGVLVAYNLWLEHGDLDEAKALAGSLRGPAVRTLGLQVGDEVQVSVNLIDPLSVGPADVYDAVASRAPIARAELVGLLPRAVLDAIDPTRWSMLDVGIDQTIEERIAQRVR